MTLDNYWTIHHLQIKDLTVKFFIFYIRPRREQKNFVFYRTVSELFRRTAVKLKANRFTTFVLDYRLAGSQRERVLKRSRVLKGSNL